MAKYNDQSRSPEINLFQLDSSSLGDIHKSVNLFTGSVNFPVKLIALSGKGGLDVTVNAFYGSDIHGIVNAGNKEAPTDVLGVGWSIPFGMIVVEGQNTGTNYDDTFYLVSGGSTTPLIRIGTEDNGKRIVFGMKKHQFWKILYYPDPYEPRNEKWEIIREDGTKEVYGDGSIQLGVKWKNWIGSSGSRGGSSYPVAWNLKEVRNRWGDKITFQYQYENLPIAGSASMLYTRACYLERIVDVYGQTVSFFYKEKEPFERQHPFKPPVGGENAFQFPYIDQYLDKIEVRNKAEALLSTIQFDYAFYNVAPYPFSNDDFYKKRYLRSIAQKNNRGHGLPEIQLDYYKSHKDIHPGALKEIIYPEGAIANYTYQTQDLLNSSTELNLSTPGTGFTPRVWYGPGYVIVTWHHKESNKLILGAYTWNGTWVYWSFEQTWKIDTDTLHVIPGDGFFTVKFKEPSSAHFCIYLFRSHEYRFGEWHKRPYKIIVKDNQESPRFVFDQGKDFICFFDPDSNQVRVIYWNAVDKGWVEQSYSIKLSSQVAIAAHHNYILCASYKDKTLGLTTYYSDVSQRWKKGDEITETLAINWEYTDVSQLLSAGSSFGVLTAISDLNQHAVNYTFRIYEWDEGYHFTKTIKKSYEQSTSIKNPVAYSVISESLIANAEHLFRYDGKNWIESELNKPSKDNEYQYAYGSDLACQRIQSDNEVVFRVQRFDPYTLSWKNETSLAADEGLSTVSGNVCAIGKRIFYREQSLKWNNIGELAAFANPDSVRIGGSNFLVYEDKGGENCYIDFIKGGRYFKGPTLAERKCHLDKDSAGLGKQLIGPDSFITFRGRTFDEARNLYLQKVVHESIEKVQQSRIVARLNINDGYKDFLIDYEYDDNSATFDPVGKIAQYIKARIYTGGKESCQGYTENIFFNGLNPEAPGVIYPHPDNYNNVLHYFSLLNGELYQRITFDGDGREIASSTNYLYTYEDKRLYGVYTRLKRMVESQSLQIHSEKFREDALMSGKLDGKVVRISDTDYNSKGQPSINSSYTHNSRGEEEKNTQETTYAWEVYPDLEKINLLVPIAEQRERNASRDLLKSCFVTTYQSVWNSGIKGWAPHKSYRWDGTGEAHFDYQHWSGKKEPDKGWIKYSEVQALNGRGEPIEVIDIDAVPNSTLYDGDNKNEIASFHNSSLTNQEASFYSFEAYENNQNWQFEDDNLVTTDCYAGSRSLKLYENPAGLSKTIKIKNGTLNLILTCFLKTEEGFEGANGEAAWEIIVKSGEAKKTILAPIPGTDKEWTHFHLVINREDFAVAEMEEITLKLFNTKDRYLLVDCIGFIPFLGSFTATVFKKGIYELQDAVISHKGYTNRKAYNYLDKKIAEIGNAGVPTSLTAPFSWRSLNRQAVFNEEKPNHYLSIAVRTGGSYDSFQHGDDWQERWEASEGWSVEEQKLNYRGGEKGSIYLKDSTEYYNYGLRLRIENNETVDLPIGIEIGKSIGLRWQKGFWELYDIKDQRILQSREQLEYTACDWLIVVNEHSLLFYADGEQIFAQWFERQLKGTTEFYVSNKVSVCYLILFIDPILNLDYFDNSGRMIQSQSLDDRHVLVSENIYDGLSRNAIETKTAAFGRGVFQYRRDFVRGFDWTTGIMEGEVSELFPDDEGYPYTRILFENAPAELKREQGAPGKLLSINLQQSPQERHTMKYNYLTNKKYQFYEDLPAEEYYIEEIIDQDGVPSSTLKDKTGNPLLFIQGDQSNEPDQFNISRYYYNGYGHLSKVLLPNYFQVDLPDREKFVIQLAYDIQGNLIERLAPESPHPYRYFFDKAGRIRFMQDPNGAVSTYILYWIYDELGRIIEEGQSEAEWDRTLFEKHIDDKTWLPGPGVWTKRYTYDGDGSDLNQLGRLIEIAINQSPQKPETYLRESYVYNNDDRIIQKLLRIKGYPDKAFRSVYAYNNLGAVKKIIYNADEEEPFTVFYYFDSTGKPSLITAGIGEEQEKIASYIYDAGGAVTKELWHSGSSPMERKYAFNSAGLPTLIEDPFFKEEIDYFVKGWNDARYYTGKIAKTRYIFKNRPLKGGFINEFDYTYAYNPLGRLEAAKNSVDDKWSIGITKSITYDSSGNVRVLQRGPELEGFYYKPGTNMLLNQGPNGEKQLYAYNENGDVLESQPRGIVNIDYQHTSRMPWKIKLASGADIHYAYNGANRRIWKQSEDCQKLYLHNLEGDVILEQIKRRGKEERIFYIHGPLGLAAVQASGKTYYVIKDHLNSTRGLVEEGELVAAYNYTPFGDFLGDTFEPAGRLLPYLYTGQELEEETGLYNYKARFYDPGIGRFYSKDPAGEFISPYIYVGDDWINYVDPSGKIGFLAALLIGVLVSAAIEGAIYGIGQAVKGEKFNWKDFGIALGIGAATGLVGVGVGGVASKLVFRAGVQSSRWLHLGARLGEGLVYGAASGAASAGTYQALTNLANQEAWDADLIPALVNGAVIGAVFGVIGGYGKYHGQIRRNYADRAAGIPGERVAPDADLGGLRVRAQDAFDTRKDLFTNSRERTMPPISWILKGRDKLVKPRPSFDDLVLKYGGGAQHRFNSYKGIIEASGRTSQFWTKIAAERNYGIFYSGWKARWEWFDKDEF